MKDRCNSLSADGSLFTSVRWPRARQPRRAEVLDLIEDVAPWSEIDELVRPVFHSDRRATGRPGYSLRMLIRCRIVQLLWQLSDDATEAAILDSHATAKFVGTDPWAPRPPSATRVREFRRMLDYHLLAGDFELLLRGALHKAGFECRPGFIREPIFRRRPLT